MAKKKSAKQNSDPQPPEETAAPETPSDSISAQAASPDSGTNAAEPENAENQEDQEDQEAFGEIAKVQTGSNERLKEMMDTNFIEYASYVIKERAIPDIDDGLKPVQRRILWAMHRTDDGSFHKVANVIGDTMKFHPHGDASIGDALVVLANKELYIDKQGNYGSIITGHPAAAPRYIEARLSPLGREVLFNDDITEVVDSYDGRNVEPVSLPIKIPSLLLMGAEGIAVGTNTRIMPHNFNELLNAQIAILQDRDFELYPDFLQGGIMDASKYEDGNGKITVRAKIDIDGRNLIIREIPPFTNTEKLMESIEKAATKGKIKIATIHDLTAKEVCIEIVPQRGYDPQRALQALYSYTDCSMTVTLNLMVIKENRPVRMNVKEVLYRNTEKLLEYLRAELNIEIGKLLEKLLSRTLAQIFVEERIYKRIETCKTYERIAAEVRAGLENFRDEWAPIVQMLKENVELRGLAVGDKAAELRLKQLSEGIIPDADVETLLAIPIRRISLFDIEKNKKEMEEIRKQLDINNKNLKRLKSYAVKYLTSLLEKYGPNFPRRTKIELEGFQKIDMEKIALNNIRVYWDRKGCYVGTNVKSDDVVVCNEFDHLLCIERKGNYKIIDIPEKILVKTLSLRNVPTVFNMLDFMLFPVIASDIAFPNFNPMPASFDPTKNVVISVMTVPLSESNKPEIIPETASNIVVAALEKTPTQSIAARKSPTPFPNAAQSTWLATFWIVPSISKTNRLNDWPFSAQLIPLIMLLMPVEILVAMPLQSTVMDSARMASKIPLNPVASVVPMVPKSTFWKIPFIALPIAVPTCSNPVSPAMLVCAIPVTTPFNVFHEIMK